MRFLVRCAYDGSAYCGWQSQPNAPSVQETIQKALSTLLRENIEIIGCGRTDTGVHASDYFFHFDIDVDEYPLELSQLRYKLNALLPHDIVIFQIQRAHSDLHARYSAISRTYSYHIVFEKPIFDRDYVYWWKYKVNDSQNLLEELNQISETLKPFEDWKPFCKSNSGVDHYKVSLMEMQWMWEKDRLIFQVKGNRFLRGMVRLLVGAHLRIIEKQMNLFELKTAMQEQSILPKAWSVPGKALFLSEIVYPENLSSKPS